MPTRKRGCAGAPSGIPTYLAERERFCDGMRLAGYPKGNVRVLILNAVAMQVVAVGVEPGLGALDMIADPRNDPPEPGRMVHFDEMRDLMGGEIVQHVRRREDQPP